MFTTPFWPAAGSYHIHMMDIPLPESLSPTALDLIHQATGLAEAASHIHPVDLTLHIQTHSLSYSCDNFLRINSRGERYHSSLCG